MSDIVNLAKMACSDMFSCSNVNCTGCILYDDIRRIAVKSDGILNSFSYSDRNYVVINALYNMILERYSRSMAKDFKNKLCILVVDNEQP